MDFICRLWCNCILCGRMSGTLQWRVATPPSRDEWAIIRHLEPGRKYDIQVITRSDFGESSGVIQVIVAGADPGKAISSFSPVIFSRSVSVLFTCKGKWLRWV